MTAPADMDVNVRHEYHRHRRENSGAVRGNMLLVKDIAEQRARNFVAQRLLQARANDLKRAAATRRGREGLLAALGISGPDQRATAPTNGAWEAEAHGRGDSGGEGAGLDGNGEGSDEAAMARAALARNRERIAELREEATELQERAASAAPAGPLSKDAILAMPLTAPPDIYI